MQPKISVITITYNSSKTVEETIKSIVAQDYENLEYIIIDGASTDSTLDIVNNYKDQISFILSEPDKGISDAFNKGVQRATGEIIGIINSDDVMLPGSLQAIANAYEKDVDVYRGYTVYWNPEKGSYISVKPGMNCTVRDNWGGGVNHPSTFITRRAYNKVGLYNVDYHFAMDVDMLYRLYNSGAKFKMIQKDLVLFRLGGETSKSWTKKIKERYLIRRRNGASVLLALKLNLVFAIKQIIMRVICMFVPKETLYKLKNRNND